jgi:hypothetical protein
MEAAGNVSVTKILNYLAKGISKYTTKYFTDFLVIFIIIGHQSEDWFVSTSPNYSSLSQPLRSDE